MHGFVCFPTLNIPKEGIVAISLCVLQILRGLCGRWGKQNQKDNLSTADPLHFHRLLVCMGFLVKVFGVLPFIFFRHLIKILMFSSQFSGIKDNRNKAGNQVIFQGLGRR